MKCSESWLREWVNPPIDRLALCDLLTMSGLEVEECVSVAGALTDVVIGRVVQIQKHPLADRLQCCLVDIGRAPQLNIVCGATNVKAEMKVAVAKIGAVIANGQKITPTIIREVASEGMLCSAAELGLAEQSDGLLELPIDAPIGLDLLAYMQLQDHVLDISITPNRGDCLRLINCLLR
jgi:phenylalanyl-tRNA synthetase beta chain